MASTEVQGADYSPHSLTVIPVPSEASGLSDDLLGQISKLLPEFLRSRRWFRAKARTISQIQVEDVVPFSAVNHLLVLKVSYAEGESDTYLLPLSLTAKADDAVLDMGGMEPLAVLRSRDGQDRMLYSAFANPAFRSSLLSAIAENKSFPGKKGIFSAERIEAPGANTVDLNPQLDSTVSRAEQSNTSVIFGTQFILKLFRKVEPGINPDIEVGAFLTEHGFANTPAVLGTLEYQSEAENASYSAGILQKFVPNRGDAWKYTLDSLSGFFERALLHSTPPESFAGKHPLQLMEQTVPADARQLIGDYIESARLLGQRTAEMHAVLARGTEADFAPEPFSASDAEKLYEEMHRQADTTFNVLRQKEGTITGAGAGSSRELLQKEDLVRERFAELRNSQIDAHRIRFHGDYHLGQVLYTGDDFMIIDFEGEPARPLSERRDKALALRDVAGMVRSFQYAAYAALFGQVPGLSANANNWEAVERWSAFWYAWVSAAYLKGYFETAGSPNFIPSSPDGRRLALDAFLLHKALYEVAYELNNRPDWVRIPLRGILGLIQ
ncbi:MAG: putative maltokinase [Acidobacteriaceae bacterium]|nr:putative maltokinase [Acidobacteriaceae bacterium]